jgi:phytol kinase
MEIHWVRLVLFVAMVLLCWVLSGYLKVYLGVRTAYTRKINHAVALILGAFFFLPLPLDQARLSYRLAGAILFALILLVCRYHQGGISKLIFQGYAREKDAPHEAFHIWFSWLVSLAGILLVDQLFGNRFILTLAVLLLGVGDALGEPIGVKFGKHSYSVRSIIYRQSSTRTVEGTGAVLASSFITALLGLWLLGGTSNHMVLPLLALILAGLVAVVEAYTPHGLDNLTIPLIAAVVVQGFYSFKII